MRIVSIVPTYNESYFAPLQSKFLDNQSIEPIFIDNESTDNTTDWLRTNGKTHFHLSTNGMFHLDLIQSERIRIAHHTKPDWVVYGDCDEFFIFKDSIRKTIAEAEENGCNAIRCNSFEIYNTGEHYDTQDTINQFFLGTYRYSKSGIVRIHKYNEHIRYTGDNIWIPNMKIYDVWGLNLNYGPARPAHQREAALHRSELAWAAGLNRSHGAHYRAHKTQNWTMESSMLSDIRRTPYSEEFSKLLEVLRN